jgi:UDP-3-O-acyl-N-acetylglucosamine deacetylase
MNNRLLRELLADATAWEWVTFNRPEQASAAVLHLYPQTA